MNDEPTWHAQAVEQLSQIFEKEPDAQVMLRGNALGSYVTKQDLIRMAESMKTIPASWQETTS